MPANKIKMQQGRYIDEKFQRWKIAKRNKKYFDFEMIDALQQEQQIIRRIPSRPDSREINHKIHSSFMNTTAAFSFKLQNSIEKFKNRISHTNTINISDLLSNESQFQDRRLKTENLNEPKNIIHPKSININKMLSRQQIQKLDPKQNTKNEQRYNNFYLTSPDGLKTRSFDKYTSRFIETEISQSPKKQYQIDPNRVAELKEKLQFDRTVVTWDYKKQKYDRGPIISKINKSNSLSLNPIPQQKILKGISQTNTNWRKVLHKFDRVSSKDNKAQFQRNFHSPNCDYRMKKKINKDDVVKNVKVKYKKIITEPEREIEICDIQYFRRRELKQERLRKLYAQ